MSIAIYTYRDPYKLNQEPYWNEIKTCPFFCVSQTSVNGLKYLYKEDFNQGRVTTIQNLVETMFEYWESTACEVKQHADIDNIISSDFDSNFESNTRENIKRAFLFNRDEVFNSIRVMFELSINVDDIIIEKLTPEQIFIVEVYKKILTSNKRKDFTINSDFDETYIDNAIVKTMQKAGNDPSIADVPKDCIVMQGIHQFSPIILRTIEIVSKYKKVILLFNYQPQYKNAYQTWIDIYSAFDSPIKDFGGLEFCPSLINAVSYSGNILADNLGKLINGQASEVVQENVFEIIEFDNMTEFASYVAGVFDAAVKKDPINPMGMMQEQIYSADITVNDILKIYFPEQFGERQFLDYPLGHFFLAIADMWNVETNTIMFEDIADIKECLAAGILEEDYLGQLSTIFGRLSPLFEGCSSIGDMTSRLNNLRKNKKYLSNSTEKEYVSHISYYTVGEYEIQKLENALNDLADLATYFYEDFEKQSNNFREFYRRLKGYLQQNILDSRDLNEEFSDIIRRVLERLEAVEDIDASASFECLKSTMSLYLTQETKPGNSANWIVRNFEQIDGDIVRSRREKVNGKPVVYHFTCLSDQDINAVNKSSFPWPLSDDFFEVAQEPVDWKYQVYVKSKKEYKNFKRYALLFGLEFNRANFKLSYVKRDGDTEKEPYFLLKLLGAKITSYEQTQTDHHLEDVSYIACSAGSIKKYSEFDFYRYRICKYRFLMESILEGTTVYKDSFLLTKYLEVLLENQVRDRLQGLPVSETFVVCCLNDAFDNVKKYFPFMLNINRMDAINNVKNRLLNRKSKTFPLLNIAERKEMVIRELFIHKQLADPKTFRKNILQDKFSEVTDEKISKDLSESALHNLKYQSNVDLWCQYCSNRELCVAFYTNSKM